MSAHAPSLPASLRIFLRVAMGLYILVILWQSLTAAGTGGAIPHLDKVLHMAAYAVMAAGLSYAWPSLSKAYILAGCVVLGASLEVAQGVMSLGRTASFWDALANSLGAVIGLGCILFLQKTHTE